MWKYLDEYLLRDRRKSPIWKSEAEFKLLLKEFSSDQQKILIDIFAAEGEKDKDNSLGSTLNEHRIKELEDEVDKMKSDNVHQRDEDIENSIENKNRQIFWLRRLERFCSENKIEFDIHNQKSEAFCSKINALSDMGVRIWYEQFEKSETIGEVLELYNTDEKKNKFKSRNGDANEAIRLFYLYIRKNTNFSMRKFIDFLKKTLDEYDKS